MSSRALYALGWPRSFFSAALLVAAALVFGSCSSPEQIGAQAQANLPAGHGVVVGHVALDGASCSRGVINVAQWEDGAYANKSVLWGVGDQWKSGLAFRALEPGTYDVVSVGCTTTETVLVARQNVDNFFYASPPKLKSLLGFIVHDKSLASFTVGPNEVIDIGTIVVRRARDLESKSLRLEQQMKQGEFSIGGLPEPGLATWKRLHPEWGQKLISRPMTPRT
jgi:hypothetical protein